eukprot:761000-Hanusia_phi.AAC.1
MSLELLPSPSAEVQDGYVESSCSVLALFSDWREMFPGHLHREKELVREFYVTQAADWQKSVLVDYGTALQVEVVSSRKLHVVCSSCSMCKGAVARHLVRRPEIEWVEVKPKVAARGNFVSSSLSSGDPLCQGGEDEMFAQALNGEGEVVSIADSGIDHRNCMFWDELPLPVNSFDGRKRKVVSYFSYANCSICGVCSNKTKEQRPCGDHDDAERGHGTYVSGAVAGSAACPQKVGFGCTAEDVKYASIYNALAKEAKIAFTDIMVGKSELSPPLDLHAHLFPDPYNVSGARVMLLAWGCVVGANEEGTACNRYTSQCQDIDLFTWENRDALVIVAAGNDGERAAAQTVGAPATSKNSIAVGFTETCVNASVASYAYTDPFVAADCGLFGSSRCCLSSYESRCSMTQCCGEGREDCCFASFTRPNMSPDNVAEGSSRGLTMDGRIKPDVVAVGSHVVSARAAGASLPSSLPFCSLPSEIQYSAALTSLTGSSSSAPGVAAAAIIIR